MKRQVRFGLLMLLLLAFPQVCVAFTKTITINWSMSDTSGVTGYKMYYSYDIDMSEKTVACETIDQLATSLTCENVVFNQNTAYFTIAAVTSSAEYESTPKLATVGLKPVLDFKMEIVQ